MSDFEQIPIDEIVAQCARYYWVQGEGDGIGSGGGGLGMGSIEGAGVAVFSSVFPVEMRRKPTLEIGSAVDLTIESRQVQATSTSIASQASTSDKFGSLLVGMSGSQIVGSAAFAFTNSSGAKIAWNAEL